MILYLEDNEIKINRCCLRGRACEFLGVLVVCPVVKCHQDSQFVVFVKGRSGHERDPSIERVDNDANVLGESIPRQNNLSK